MEKKRSAGISLGIIGALINIGGISTIFMKWYDVGRNLEAAEPGCELLLAYIMPMLSDVSILAGLLFAMGAYCFYIGHKWGFPALVIAVCLSLQGSWFINVPFMSGGAPPIYFLVFIPNLILYFFIMRRVGGLSWGHTLLGFGAGMAFVLCFMNGIASWSRMMTIDTPFYYFAQRLSWFSSLFWGIFLVGMLIKPKEWMRIVALAGAFLQLLVGGPLAVQTTMELGRFSLFSIAPIISLIVGLLLLSPAKFRSMTGAEEETGQLAAA